MQRENLLSYDFVERRTAKSEVRIHAWWFDIAHGGSLLGYSKELNRFIPAGEAMEHEALGSAAE